MDRNLMIFTALGIGLLCAAIGAILMRARLAGRLIGATDDSDSKLEPIMLFLFGGLALAVFALFASELLFPMDGQMFQVVANLVAGFSGALFMRAKPKNIDGAGSGAVAVAGPIITPPAPLTPPPAAPTPPPSITVP